MVPGTIIRYIPLGSVVLALWMWACLELARGARSAASRRIMNPFTIGVVVAIIWAGNLINHYLRV